MRAYDLWGVIRGMIHYNPSGEIAETVILAGLPRGGTTWVSEVINYDNSYRYMFEPFYPRYVPSIRQRRIHAYMRPGDLGVKNFSKAVDKIVTGNIRNPWIDRFNRKVIYDKILIKDIRINLLLGWLAHHYPNLKMILLMRHPFALAFSQERVGWGAGVKAYYQDAQLVKDYLERFIPSIAQAESHFEKRVVVWCIENYVPLHQLSGKKNVYVCFYEWFCADVVAEAKKLLFWLGKNTAELSEDHLRAPSKTSKKDSAVYTGDDLICRWTKHISPSDVGRGMKILEVFGLHKIYEESPLPLLSSNPRQLLPF